MSRRAVRAAAVLTAAGVVVLLPTAPTTAAGPGLPGYLASASADGVRVGVLLDHYLVVSNVVDAGGPAAQALVDGFGDSTGYAAYPYPGEIVLTAHGLSQGAAPSYPLIAQSSNPTQPDAHVSQGPYDLRARSGEDTSSAVAQAAADGGAVVAGRTRSTASVTHDPLTGGVTAEAETTLEGLSFGGVLSFGRVHSHVRVIGAPGKAPVRTSDTEVGDVTVSGQRVGLTDKGLVLAGTDVPLPPDSTANAALVAAGITVHWLQGYAAGPTATAPGVAVSVVQDVPGAGRTTVTYSFGQASATARPGAVSATGTRTEVVGGTGQPGLPGAATSGGTAGAYLPVSGPAGAALGSPGGALLGTTRALQPVRPLAAGTPATGLREAALPTGPSSASLYAVVAGGAIVMAAAAQLFRVLAVRLAWS